MKRLLISEEEKKHIMNLHKSFILSEQEGSTTTTTTVKPIDYKISDLQGLVGAGTDNILGPKTFDSLSKKIDDINAKKQETAKTAEVEKGKEAEKTKQEKLTQVKVQYEKLKSGGFSEDEILSALKNYGYTPEEISTVTGTSEKSKPMMAKDDIQQTKDTSVTPKDQEIKLG
jgi:hypothetical protein